MAEIDKFKDSFKLLKKLPVEDLRKKVIDFRDPDKHPNELSTHSICANGDSHMSAVKAAELGLRPPHQWTVYRLNAVPGLLVIPNPFLPCGQHHWVRRCLVDYPVKPNVCNLDAHMTRPGNGQLWPHPSNRDECIKEVDSASKNESSTQHSGCKCVDVCTSEDKSHKQHQEQSDTCESSVNSPRKKMKLSKPDKLSLPVWLSKERMLYKLRWVTLGYHYDWTAKEYSPHKMSMFPEELAQLSAFLLANVGFENFRAEAGIVNYYHLDSTLSGHTDHSEKDLSLPLLSVSLGQSAVFLIGGQTKQVSPLPLLLTSGDIVIMSGASRLAYHGVPKVLAPSPHHTVPQCLSRETLEQCMCRKATEHITSGSLTRTDCVVAGAEDSGSSSSIEGGFCVKDSELACTHTYSKSSICEDEASMPILKDTVRTNVPLDTCDTVHDSSKSDASVQTVGDIEPCSVCHQLASNWDMFVDYLSLSRININVRQVVSEKFKFS